MIAYLSAKSQKGNFLLRIEDLDKLRCPSYAAEKIIDDLKWFGFSFDGEIVYQSKRTAVYEHETDKLKQAGLVYPCYCSRAQLHAATAPHGDTPVYNGRCRALKESERPDKPPCLRVIVPGETIAFTDGIMGDYSQNLKTECRRFHHKTVGRSLRLSACGSRRRRPSERDRSSARPRPYLFLSQANLFVPDFGLQAAEISARSAYHRQKRRKAVKTRRKIQP